MSRDPSARSKALRAERRAEEKSGLGLITIKPLSSGASSSTNNNALEGSGADGGGGSTTGTAGKGKGFKKGGFRNAFAATTTPPTTTGDNEVDLTRATGSGGGVVAAREEKHSKVGTTEAEIGNDGAEKNEVVDEEDIGMDMDMDTESENEPEVYAAEGGRYDPRRPTGCGEACRGMGIEIVS